MLIDLHTHSSASDGTDSPALLVANAAAAGLDVVAITDHDTTRGWAEAQAALPAGLALIRGAEFSCVYQDPDVRIPLHMLGYLFDPEHEALRAERERLRANRLGRGRQIVENMAADGIPISWQRVTELADGGAVGRPHIGRALVEAGVVPDVTAAFDQLLNDGSKYYVEKANTDVFDAVAMIRSAGGVAVFAHPLARRRGVVVSDEVIVALAQAGIAGIEVDHPDHVEVDRAHLRELAAGLDLLPFGSSDYHGTNKPTPLGACTTAPEVYERLISLPAWTGPVPA